MKGCIDCGDKMTKDWREMIGFIQGRCDSCHDDWLDEFGVLEGWLT